MSCRDLLYSAPAEISNKAIRVNIGNCFLQGRVVEQQQGLSEWSMRMEWNDEE